ncbi:unnamed protein product [Meganyctiphanes norvegica]|uniref:Uncharacterized protein n=1 Tax=Meganyctiphanes norvegica TaxID=48144 RepID=A0AAV2QY66_MEGNR
MLLRVIEVTLCLLTLSYLSIGVEQERYMGDLTWCPESMCLCQIATYSEVNCFENEQIYQLLGFNGTKLLKIRRQKLNLPEHFHWCNDLCLCHNKNKMKFQCVTKENLYVFIRDTIGEEKLGEHRLLEVVEEVEEDLEFVEEPVSHKRKKKGKRKGSKKRKHHIHATTVPSMLEEEFDLVELTSPLATVPPQFEPEPPRFETIAPIFEPDTPRLEPEAPWFEPFESFTTTTDSVVFGEVDGLPKQEAHASSPSVTAHSAPIRKQSRMPVSDGDSPQVSTRETDLGPPKVSPIREYPLERKTVAGEVSQDLEELSDAVSKIEDDIILNQRLLLVTCIVAAIAMIGVAVLALYTCSKRRSSQSSSQANTTSDSAKTKVNLEEAW